MRKGTLLTLVILFTSGFLGQNAQLVSRTTDPGVQSQLVGLPPGQWPLNSFDQFTRIEIGRTPKPWLNVLGNGLFGGHELLLLANRQDGQEFRVNTAQSAITDTDLHLAGMGTLYQTIHGIGYSTLSFGDKPTQRTRVTYFLEATTLDSEVWLIDNPAGIKLTLHYGKRTSTLDHTAAFRLSGDRIDEIPVENARGR